MSVRSNAVAATPAYDGDLDVRALGRALWRKKLWILAPTLLVALITAAAVNIVTPKYKSEARLLYDGRENVFLRPEAEKSNADHGAADAETLTSQVQLVLSRELAREVIAKLKLNERPEFDPVLRSMSPLKYLLVLAGISRDPMRTTPEERVLEAYFDRLTAYPFDRSRVIVIEFQSADPELAALVANAVADGYLALQQEVKQDQTRAAGQWLSDKIEALRRKVADAEAKAEEFRSKTSLFVGTNNTTLSNQQLGEFNSRLAAARGQKSDAETRARLIRDMLRRGEQIDASDIVNSERIRRLSEQRAILRAQLAEQSSTLLDGHPRIKELKAQIADFDQQIRSEADMMVRTLESDAKIAQENVASLSTVLDGLKRQAASTNQEDVQLRALDREARAQRDLLESYLAKYREATARDSIGAAPADTRVISRAIVSNTPYFPKKLPIVLVAIFATMAVCMGFVTTSELMRNSSSPVRAEALPASGRLAATTHPDLGVAFSAIDEVADQLRGAGQGGRRVAVFGSSRYVGTTLASITLARAMARDSKAVLVDLALGAPNLAVISMDPAAPGVADVVRGTASFGDVITRDRLSRLHLVAAGRVGPDGPAIIASPRLTMMLEALARSYDHVVVDAGAVTEAAVERVFQLAPRAVLVTSDQSTLATKAGRERLAGSGYGDIAVLDGAPIIAAGTRSEAA
jgi:polysaccharide biosynthesis transport protein